MGKIRLSYNPDLTYIISRDTESMDTYSSNASEAINKVLQNSQAEREAAGLNFSDSTLVAETLSLEGELSLLKDDLSSGLKLFDHAIRLDPENSQLYCNQGLSLFEYGTEDGKEKTLLLANKKFKMATFFSPDYFDAWHMWGSTLCFLGKTFKEHHYFIEAEEKLRKAVALSENQSIESSSDLHWDFGNVKSAIASYSKEAMDWQHALDSFQKATSFQEHLPSEFWNDYGKACLELSYCVNDIRLCVKAIHCFKHALSHHPLSSADGWQHLSEALHHLYKYTHDDDHFTQANECFSAAAQIRPQDAQLWLNWAQFLCESSRKTQDNKRVKDCIEKCHRAYACDANNPHILAVWGEALALLGDLTERLDLLYEGQNKISQALDLAPDLQEIWYAQGMCLHSLGRYFSDFDYYYQAIEKFQQGISLDRTLYNHWHAMALSYAAIGQLDIDTEALEKGVRFFTKALELQPNNSYYHFDYALCLSRLGEFAQSPTWLELSLLQFEKALSIQKNAIYLHPEWLFHYARTMDLMGDFHEEESYYTRAVEILSHVLMIDPDFPGIHHHLALSFSHLGELTGEVDHFYKALHYYRLATRHEEENDQTLLDLGITLINIAQHTSDPSEADTSYRDAEIKLTQSAKWGNVQAYYHLAGLYSLLGQQDKALRFLQKADNFDALPSLEEVLQDDWLEGLRSTAGFREFLMLLEKRPNLQQER